MLITIMKNDYDYENGQHLKHWMLARMWSHRNSHSLPMGLPNSIATWKKVWKFLAKLSICLPYDSAMTCCAVYPNELKTFVYSKTHTWIFIAALSIIATVESSWDVLEWVNGSNKLGYIQTRENHSGLKRNELSNHEKTWRKLKGTLLSERSQWEKATCCMSPFTPHSIKVKLKG